MGKNIRLLTSYHIQKLIQNGTETCLRIMFLEENFGEYLHDCGRQKDFS